MVDESLHILAREAGFGLIFFLNLFILTEKGRCSHLRDRGDKELDGTYDGSLAEQRGLHHDTREAGR